MIHEEDNCSFLNISKLRNRPEICNEPYEHYIKIFKNSFNTIMKYTFENNLCLHLQKYFFNYIPDNIRIIKYDVGEQFIKDHSDVAETY